MKSKTPFVFVLLFLLAASATGQQQDIVALPDFPVPAWPESGAPPADMKDKYVFVDLAKNEYVLSYPENLGSDTFEKDGPGPIRTARYELHRNVEPAVAAEVSSVAGDRYKYVYTVSNGASAKQSIDQWAMSLPAAAASTTIRQPAGWFGVIQRERTLKVRNPEWIPAGAAAIWSFQKPEELILAGSSKTGFELESALRPGFTTSYFRKAESIEAKIATQGTGLPKAVQEQVDLILAVEYDSKTLLTLGPKFEATATNETVAADFAQGIDVLTRAGVLNGNSEFVRNTLTELRGAAKSFTTAATTPIETEILNAVIVSLRLK